MFLNISIFRHILCRLKTGWKRNKYGSIPCKNGISRKRTEKPHFYFRKYGNGIPQIWKQTDKNRKRNGSERKYFRPFSTLISRGDRQDIAIGLQPKMPKHVLLLAIATGSSIFLRSKATFKFSRDQEEPLPWTRTRSSFPCQIHESTTLLNRRQ